MNQFAAIPLVCAMCVLVYWMARLATFLYDLVADPDGELHPLKLAARAGALGLGLVILVGLGWTIHAIWGLTLRLLGY